jgi:hypothetical protein
MLSLIAAAALAAGSPPDGLIRHYVRSNRDGSEPEHIVHFRPEPTQVAVYKYMSKCTTAAFVTANMDPARWEAVRLDAGKVARDGSQARFGVLTLDPATRLLSASVTLPEGVMRDSATLPSDMPWFLFDYDLGDLNAYLQEKRPAGDFMFSFALVWPEQKDFLTHMATIHVAHRGIEMHGGNQRRRFDLHFIAGKEGSGTLWTDPASGAIVEAEASLPNHPGMKDFRLKLRKTEKGGAPAWRRLLRGHYANCPR